MFSLKKGAITLNASTLAKNNKSVLVFDSERTLYKNTVSYGYSILNKDGLARALNSITHSDINAPRKRGDIVEERGNQSLITQSLTSNNFVPKPTAIIIVQNDKGGNTSLKKSSEEEAKQIINQNLNTFLNSCAPLISSNKYIELFNDLRKDIPVYVVSSGKGLEKEIENILG